tara:strand:+ start:306 stop:506 length:201 start_codon:yes stop_codon:yes gene_type:complete
MKTVSAVEWLEKKLIESGVNLLSEEVEFIQQAKAMEKEQIMEAWIATDNELQRIAAEQYYNETYGK